VAGVFFRTLAVVTEKVFDVVPAATTTVAGTDAMDVLELPSVTTAPALGAGAVSVTVPVEDPPPTTLAGLSVSVARAAGGGAAGGLTVRVVVLVTPP